MNTKITKDEINRTEIARGTGYNLAHISRIFSGKARPSYECEKKIAKYLNISIDELHELIES